jgi:hypothetical protein
MGTEGMIDFELEVEMIERQMLFVSTIEEVIVRCERKTEKQRDREKKTVSGVFHPERKPRDFVWISLQISN